MAEADILNNNEEELEWLWFCMIPGLYRSDRKNLLEEYTTVTELKTAAKERLDKSFYLKERQRETIVKWQKKTLTELLPILQEKGISFYSHKHKCYPKKLKAICDYPYGIFVRGTLPDTNRKTVAIVGARMCTNYGRKLASLISSELAKRGVIIVSGMALGIDGIAQMSALEQNGSSIAIVGSGCDICYPREHIELFHSLIQKGCIISEFPPGTVPMPSHFPQRNRIISGLCDAVIVIEAKKKSGSLITADLALEQGRDVFAIPGRIGDPLSEGCNHLIQQGAGMITDISSLLESLGFEVKEKKQRKTAVELNTCENMILLCLDYHGKSLEEITDCIQYPRSEVLTALMQLQLKKMVVEISKNRYAIV